MSRFRHVFDSYAMLCLFNDEPGADIVEKSLKEANKGNGDLFLCTVNISEIFYNIYRRYGSQEAQHKLTMILNMPITLCDVTLEVALYAAEIKSKYPIALGDCFAIGLAKLNSAKVITGDPEFKKVQNEVDIIWLPHNK